MRRGALLLALGCAAVAPAAAAPRPAPALAVTVAAASSLRDAFEDVGRSVRGRLRVEFGFAGSQLLRTQIEQGLDPDVIALADTVHVNALRRQGLISPPHLFARTRLVIVTPAREPGVRSIRDLARAGTRLVVADPAVPAGRYARLVLDRVAADPALGPEVRRGIEANVRSREISVRAVLAKVALGEADAGLVYATDAATADVRSVEIPPPLNVTAEYFVATLARGARRGAARAFVDYLTGPEGRRILRRHGFGS